MRRRKQTRTLSTVSGAALSIHSLWGVKMQMSVFFSTHCSEEGSRSIVYWGYQLLNLPAQSVLHQRGENTWKQFVLWVALETSLAAVGYAVKSNKNHRVITLYKSCKTHTDTHQPHTTWLCLNSYTYHRPTWSSPARRILLLCCSHSSMQHRWRDARLRVWISRDSVLPPGAQIQYTHTQNEIGAGLYPR